jgi:uncharacterized RDD family membrane protein YckC
MVGVSVAAAMPTPPRTDTPATRAYGEAVLRVRASGFARRVAAAAIDAAVLLGLSLCVTFVTALVLGARTPNLREIGPDFLVAGLLDRNPMAVGALGLFLGLTVLYQLYCAGMAGQTLGMRLLGIRLISARGRAPGAVRGLLRVLGFAVSVVPGALGWLWAIFDREHRALHDHMAGTYVILDL